MPRAPKREVGATGTKYGRHDDVALAPIALPTAEFRRRLASWYRDHARTLPWRGVNDPYATWLSEIMLQQTRVATVIERYQEFLYAFPTIADLAAAHENEVLALWSGLGYYRRARMLHRGAQFVVRELGGVLPATSCAPSQA
jgi:A/G-specific adenine glycosylase